MRPDYCPGIPLHCPSSKLSLPLHAGYWVIDTPGTPIPLRPPYQLALTSAQGQRLVVPLANLRAQDLGVNFG